MMILPYQPELSPPLPEILGNAEYQEYQATLIKMDRILKDTGAERDFVEARLQAYVKEAAEESARAGQSPREITEGELTRVVKHAVQALRCTIARELRGMSCRTFSIELADSALLRRFCEIDGYDPIQVPSKSSIDRYRKLVPETVVRDMVDRVNKVAAGVEEGTGQALGLERPLDLEAYFVDTTCVTANIHYPVDYVLLRDASRTLIKAIVCIRRHGLKHRIGTPEEFLSKMNKLCMEMAHAGRKKNGRKERRRILRAMKKLLKVIEGHAQRYRELLEQRWQETDLSEGQAAQILRRIDGVLEQLPAAVEQARVRITGEGKVENDEKILSLYEQDIHVMVRGKSGARVEFGNCLLLGEISEGVIVDWKLFKDGIPADNDLVKDTVERFRDVFGSYPGALATDRGFSGQESRDLLAENEIYDAICPKSPRELRRRMEEPRFRQLQKRRAQTEGRIGILKNAFLGKQMRTKGFLNRESNVSWAVLAHNLWVIGRLALAAEEEEKTQKAA